MENFDPAKTESGNKKLIFVAIVIMVLGALAIGDYYLTKKSGDNAPVASVSSTPTVGLTLDLDFDIIPDLVEKIIGTNPEKVDTDGDGFNDLAEIKSGYSPLIAGSAKLAQEEWQSLKDKIKAADKEFFEENFAVEKEPIVSLTPSVAPKVSLSPSPTINPIISPTSSNTPLSFVCGNSTVSDIDNNIYKTVKIGEQCWLEENLKVTKNPAGEAITRYCFIGDPKNCNIDGGLYDWNTTMNKSTTESAQGICPNGWHVPKNLEWLSLEGSAKDNFNKLKTVFAGFRNNEGKFSNREVDAFFWSSTQDSAIGWDGVDLYPPVFSRAREYGLSVRCLKD